MNTTEQIIQFALTRKFGLNFDSSDNDIKAIFGAPDHDYDEAAPFMYFGNLEIGLATKGVSTRDAFRKVAYFKFCVDGCLGSKQFEIPGVLNLHFKVADVDMREVVQVLVNHSIWFEHIHDYFIDDENCDLRTLDQQKHFHFVKVKNRWLLSYYFCSEI